MDTSLSENQKDTQEIVKKGKIALNCLPKIKPETKKIVGQIFKIALALVLIIVTVSGIWNHPELFYETVELCDRNYTNQEAFTDLSETETLVQEFTAPAHKVYTIGILYATYCDTLEKGQVIFRLYDTDKTVLYEEAVDVTELKDNSYYNYHVNAELVKGKNYAYEISATGCEEDKSPVVWVGDFDGKAGTLTYGDEVLETSIFSRFEIGQFNDMPFKNALLLAAILIVMFIPVQAGPKVSRILNTVGLFIYPLISFYVVESLFQDSFSMADMTVKYNYLLYLMIYLLIFLISGRYRFSIIFGNILTMAIGVANSFVIEFRGNPICPWDLMSLKTATAVAGEYNYELSQDMLHSILWLVLASVLLFFVKETKDRWYLRLVSGVGIVAYSIVLMFTFVGTSHLEEQGFNVDLWSQRKGYVKNGFYLSFIMNTKYMKVEIPENYSVEKVKEILNDYDEVAEKQVIGQQPNIIMIMNEAFSDLSVVGEFETTTDYMPFTNNLKENTVKGNLFVSIFGGGTSNTEYEVLTGNSMAYLAPGSIAYQQYISSAYTSGGLASTLKEQGYDCYAIHPMEGANWNRINVYNSMGFDEFRDVTAFETPELIRQTYISDWSTYEEIIDIYENKGNEPLFVLNVTVQNHGGYESGVAFEEPVAVQGMSTEYSKTNEFLSLMKMSDKAFKRLVAYFEKVDEPTMIVMFGDHQPAIDDAFYEELYGKSLEQLDLEEMQKRYQVPFVIWTNYDIEEKEIPAISANYLSGQVLKYAGLTIPKYFAFQNAMMEKLPVINVNGYMDAEGHTYLPDDENPYQDFIDQYKILHYNSAVDIKNTWHPMYTYEE